MSNSVEDGLGKVGTDDWCVWNKDVADTIEDATVAVTLGCLGKDSVDTDVGNKVTVASWLPGKEFVAKVESEPAKRNKHY